MSAFAIPLPAILELLKTQVLEEGDPREDETVGELVAGLEVARTAALRWREERRLAGAAGVEPSGELQGRSDAR